MDNKNTKRQNFYYVQQVCPDTENCICCLVADYFLIQRGKVPFVSALYYILLNGMNDQIYKQNLLSKKNKLNKEDKVTMTNVTKDNTDENNFQYGTACYFDKSDLPIDECEIHSVPSDDMNDQIYKQSLLNKDNQLDKEGKVTMINAAKDNTNENNFQYGTAYNSDKSSLPIDECEIHRVHSDGTNDQIYKQSLLSKENELNKEGKVIMNNAAEDNANENNFQYGREYYFDKSGLPIDECEIHRVHSECKKIIKTCCLIQTPRGFRLADFSPGMCFNLAGLSCIKNPVIQKVTLPDCECEHPKQCKVVAGYEIRAVGEVNFSISIPIYPIDGFCYPTHSHVCCSSTVPVNEIISHTCCPKPCACNEPCVDWTYAYFCTTLVEKDCGSYIRVKMGVALEYTGTCECDEE